MVYEKIEKLELHKVNYPLMTLDLKTNLQIVGCEKSS